MGTVANQQTNQGARLISAVGLTNEAIGPEDVLMVNFDKREIDTDGFYVGRLKETDGIVCRRFERSVLGGLNVGGEPYTGGFEIIAKVEKVYTSKEI
jgi:hypothetical protein